MMKLPAAPAARAGSVEIRPYAEGLDGSGPVWKAVLAGLAVLVIGGLLLVAVPAVVYGFHLAGSGASREAVQAVLTNLAANPWLYGPASVLGLALACLGGYVCARRAGGSALRAGIILAGLTVVIGLLSIDEALIPLWFSGLDIVLTAASVMLGVRLGSARRR